MDRRTFFKSLLVGGAGFLAVNGIQHASGQEENSDMEKPAILSEHRIAKIEVQRMVRGRIPQTLEHRMNELQRAGSECVGKPVAVPFFIGMVRVKCAPCCPAILYVHSNAWRAGFGSLSRLFDLD